MRGLALLTLCLLSPLSMGADLGPDAQLSFDAFFKSPVGPAGLEPSDSLMTLDHHRVRLSGFLLDTSDPDIYVLSPMALKSPLDEDALGDLPPSAVCVHGQAHRQALVGRLELGTRECLPQFMPPIHLFLE